MSNSMIIVINIYLFGILAQRQQLLALCALIIRKPANKTGFAAMKR